VTLGWAHRMTLRLRLMVLMMAIVAAGLVISDLVTYHALRSFLVRQLDEQLDTATYPVGRALLSTSGLGPQVPAAPPLDPSHKGLNAVRKAFLNGGGLNGGTGASVTDVLVPAGTFGLLRSPSGVIEARAFFDYGGKSPATPPIPGSLPGSGSPPGPDLYFTTGGTGPGAVSYRAVAKPLVHDSGVIVIAVPLTGQQGTLRRLVLIEIIASTALLIGLGILSWFMVRRDLQPLADMTETAGAIARGDLSERVTPAPAGTEVGQLGEAFNTMVDGIEAAFAARTASEERLRRFLADASHELRTPLTSIRGHAELFDLGVRDRPEELARSLQHIRDEASRMSTLVDDLFLLAQLDHERPLRLEPLDLADVVHHSVDTIGISAPDRSIGVDVDGPVVIEGDGLRMRQVVDNLLVNALMHTPPGTGVDIRVGRRDGWATLTVHDQGPGIDPSRATRIFEPFFREDPSRSRASGGAGLGLAIVEAIVTAHHGSVRVVPVPAPGATFEVRIPEHQTDPGGPGTDRGEPATDGRRAPGGPVVGTVS